MEVKGHSCEFMGLGSKGPLGDNQQAHENQALTQDSTHHEDDNADQRDPGGERRCNTVAGNNTASRLSFALQKSFMPLSLSA